MHFSWACGADYSVGLLIYCFHKVWPAAAQPMSRSFVISGVKNLHRSVDSRLQVKSLDRFSGGFEFRQDPASEF